MVAQPRELDTSEDRFISLSITYKGLLWPLMLYSHVARIYLDQTG